MAHAIMSRQPTQSQNKESMPVSSPPSLNHFQFTFNCSASNSGGNSFIEPDPDAQNIDSESLTDSVQNFPEEFGRTYHAYRAGCKLEQPILQYQCTDTLQHTHFPMMNWNANV
jgi:hypothetical protein